MQIKYNNIQAPEVSNLALFNISVHFEKQPA